MCGSIVCTPPHLTPLSAGGCGGEGGGGGGWNTYQIFKKGFETTLIFRGLVGKSG